MSAMVPSYVKNVSLCRVVPGTRHPIDPLTHARMQFSTTIAYRHGRREVLRGAHNGATAMCRFGTAALLEWADDIPVKVAGRRHDKKRFQALSQE